MGGASGDGSSHSQPSRTGKGSRKHRSSAKTKTKTKTKMKTKTKTKTSATQRTTIMSTPRISVLPDYNAIAKCAKTPLSYIVEDMKSGCGDASASTSFDCFCKHKSSSVNSVISTDVQKACHDDVLVGQAQAVFSEYCDLAYTPVTAIPRVVAPPTTLASTVAELSTTIATVTEISGVKVTETSRVKVTETSGVEKPVDSSPASSSSSGGLPQSTVIAVAVCIPVIIVAVSLFGFLFWRRRRAMSAQRLPSSPPSVKTSQIHPLTRSPSGASPLTLDIRTASDVDASNKSFGSEVPDPGTQELFTSLPPLTERDEDATVAPLVPQRSPLRTLSNRSAAGAVSAYRGAAAHETADRSANSRSQSTDRRGTI